MQSLHAKLTGSTVILAKRRDPNRNDGLSRGAVLYVADI